VLRKILFLRNEMSIPIYLTRQLSRNSSQKERTKLVVHSRIHLNGGQPKRKKVLTRFGRFRCEDVSHSNSAPHHNHS
jgi:hypothetical protein